MTSSTKDHLRQILNVVFSLSQIFTGYFLTLLGIGTDIGQQSAASKTPVIPATYAFSIWAFIFLFSLLYAIYQALPGNRYDNLLRRIGWYTAFAFFGNTVWIVVAETVTFGWPTAIIIIFLILIPSLTAFFQLTNYGRPLGLREKTFILIPISVLSGWVSVATFANISSVLEQLNFGYFGLSLVLFSALLIVIATAFSSVVIYMSKGNIFYSLTIIWALFAILIENTRHMPNMLVARVTAAMIIVIFIAVFYGRKKK